MAERHYFYAIVDSNRPIVGHCGLAEVPLRNHAVGELGAVTSWLPWQAVQPTPENLVRHEEVVETLLAAFTVLPARFGTVFSDEDAVQVALAEHYSRFVANLDLVRGRVEVGVKALWREADGEPQARRPERDSADRRWATKGPGAQYLWQRMQENVTQAALEARGVMLGGQLDGALRSHARAGHREPMRTPRLVLNAAYLIDLERMGEFRAVLEELKGHYPHLRFLFSGPWPAYHFCDMSGRWTT